MCFTLIMPVDVANGACLEQSHEEQLTDSIEERIHHVQQPNVWI